MKQGYIFRLFLFITALLGYLYLFDPSLVKFIRSMQEVMNLNMEDRHFLNSIIWIIGFCGILSYLSSDQKIFRVTAWIIFIASTFINFLHIQAMGSTFSMESVVKISSLITDIGIVHFSELMKFLFFTIALVGISIMIKPLSINFGKYLSLILGILLVAILGLFKGNIALQSTYLVPGMILYHYLVVGFVFLKAYMSSNSIDPELK